MTTQQEQNSNTEEQQQAEQKLIQVLRECGLKPITAAGMLRNTLLRWHSEERTPDTYGAELFERNADILQRYIMITAPDRIAARRIALAAANSTYEAALAAANSTYEAALAAALAALAAARAADKVQ